MKLKKLIPILILTALLAVGCSPSNSDQSPTTSPEQTTTPSSDGVLTAGDYFSEKDLDNTYSNEVVIDLSSPSSPSLPSVSVNGDELVISQQGTYLLTGEYSGTVRITAEKKVTLVLRDAKLTSPSYAAIYDEVGNVTLFLEGDNTAETTGSFVQRDANNVDGAVFMKGDLIVKGNGSLSVSSPAQGIVVKDEMKLISGTVSVRSEKHGFDVNDNFGIAGGTVTVTAQGDGIHVATDDAIKGNVLFAGGNATLVAAGDGVDASGTGNFVAGTLSVTAGTSTHTDKSQKGIKTNGTLLFSGTEATVVAVDDAIHSNADVTVSGGVLTLSTDDDAIHADGVLTVSGGTVNILRCYEGLEGKDVILSGGTVNLTSVDDGINATGSASSFLAFPRPGFGSATDGSILISGCNLYVNAGGDGIDCNGTLTITGGSVLIDGPSSSANGALDYETGGTVTGGEVLAIGASGMAQTLSSSTQGVIAYTSTTQPAGTAIVLSCGDEILFSVTAAKSFSSLVMTSPRIEQGKTYTLTLGNTSVQIVMTSLSYSNGGNAFGAPGGNGGPGGRK
ncbi:MAG: carbohydrate-binding domain-containing protein [Christensenellaceae bacterium]